MLNTKVLTKKASKKFKKSSKPDTPPQTSISLLAKKGRKDISMSLPLSKL